MLSHPATLLAILLLPSVCGWLAAIHLRQSLLELLIGECGNEARAQFWCRLTVVGMILGPTALALMRAEAWEGWVEPIALARALLSVSLNGILAVLGFLALIMWRQIPSRRQSLAPVEKQP